MKDVNFLHTLSPKEQRAIRAWYYRTWAMGIILFICMLGMHIPQLHKWRLLKRRQQVKCKVVSNDTLNKEVQALEKQIASLSSYTATLKQYETQITNWRERITYLLDSGFPMQSCDIDSKGARSVFHLSALKQVKELVAALSAYPSIKQVHINSLQPLSGDKGYICNCTCEWVDKGNLRPK